MSGVVESTENEFRKHPIIFGGLLLGLVAVVWLYSKSGSNSASPNFTYRSGPSDASVQAGAAIQIAQIQANQAAATAAAQTSAATTLGGDYFSYLSNAAQINGNNQAAQIAATQQIAGQQIAGQVSLAQLATQLGIIQSNNATGLGVTQANVAGQVAINASNNATALGITQANVNGQVAITQTNNNLAGLYDNNLTALQETQTNDSTQYAITANNNYTSQNNTANNNAAMVSIDNYQTYEQGILRGLG